MEKYIQNTGPICRLCRVPLKSSDGCGVCGPVKGAIIWPAVVGESELETAQATVQQALRLAKLQIKRLERAMKSESDYNPDFNDAISKLLRTSKELAGEQRKLEDREAEQYARMSFEEKCGLFIEQFFSKLPSEHQRSLLKGMAELYEIQKRPQLASNMTIDDAEIVE